jgi:O-antigen/teichoic acid export membrane protein
MKSRTWTSILAYTSARILMFGCAVIILYLAGARGLLLLFLGLVVSALASYILLNKQRAIIAEKLNGRLGRAGSKVSELRGRLDEGAKAEDATDDESVRAK